MVNTTDKPVSVNINVRSQSTNVPEIRFVCIAAEDGTFADLRPVLLEDEIVNEGEKIVFLLPDGRFAGKSAEKHLKWHTMLKDDEVTIIRMDGETRDSISNPRQSEDRKSSSKDPSGGTAVVIPRNPATPSGPLGILPGSSIAVVNTKSSQFLLFYQNAEYQIMQTEYRAGSWTSSPGLFHAAPLTPLSAISWDDGAEIRIYYLNEESVLQERYFSKAASSWSTGDLSTLNVRAAKNSAIAALFQSWNKRIFIYFQADTSNAIQEYCFDGSWKRGSILPSALSGTALAAILWTRNDRPRIYYQAEDLSIREHCYDDHLGWYTGIISFGKAPACASISAFSHSRPGGDVLRVFWVRTDGKIVQRECSGWPWGDVKAVVGPVDAGAKVAAAQWDDGKYLRVYYAPTKDSLLEVCNEGNGWFEQ